MRYHGYRTRRQALAKIAAVIGKALGAALLCAPLAGAAQSLDELSFITEDYPPFNFERSGTRQGIAVDALVEMLAQAGAKKSRADIKLWPWARAYETALREKNTVLFSTTRTEAREHLFKWVGPIMPSRIVLVAKKQRGIRIETAGDLTRSEHRIGVVREDIGEQLLAALGVGKDRIVPVNSGIAAARMLQADRVDMWAYGAPVILWNLKQLGYPAGDYEEVYTLTESRHYYYALHKDTDDRLVAMLQAALDRLKATGRFNEIVASYR